MGRLRNDANVGFVATKGVAQQQIAAIFQRVSEGFMRIADIGCGEGTALAAIQRQLAAEESYGIEVHPDRAKEAATRLTYVLHEDVMQTVLDEECMSLLYLNPPYQDAVHSEEDNAIRVEHQWFARFWRVIVRGGILVYVVSRKNLIWQSCRLLTRNFQVLGVFDYTESLYDQVFIVCRRKQKPDDEPEQELYLNLVRAKRITASIKEAAAKCHINAQTLQDSLVAAMNLPAPFGTVSVPVIPNPQPFRWLSEKPHMAEVEARLRESPMWDTLRQLKYVPPLTQKIRLLMPPEVGHLVPILEAQDAVLLRDADGKNPALVKMFGDRQTVRWEEESDTKHETHTKNPPMSVLVAWQPTGALVEYR